MEYHECDQIGNDLFVAAQETTKKLGLPCHLEIKTGEKLVQEVTRLDRRPYPLADTIEYALNAIQLDSIEREGYRRALKKIIGRRKGAARNERISRDVATDFPRGQEL